MGLNVIATAEQWGSLPDEVRKHYKKDGDSYQLAIQGEHPEIKTLKAKLEKRESEIKEFRENNISLKKQNAVYEHQANEAKKVTDKATTLEQQQEQLKSAGVTSAADVQKLHARLDALEKERDAAIQAQQAVTARESLFDVATKAGIRSEARDALALLAEKDGLTTTRDGKVVFANPDGTVKQTADGDLTPGEWVKGLANNGGGYMFAPSAGTGGQTNPSGASLANKDTRLGESAIADGTVKVMG